jgi:hypothetical protein
MDPNSDLAGSTASENTGAFGRMTGALIAPVSTFREIAQKPDWIAVVIVLVVLSIISTVLVMPKLDIEGTMREQLGDKQMTQEQIDEAVQIGLKVQKFTAPIAVVSVPIVLLIMAGLLLLAFRVMGGDVGFKQAFAITSYGWLPSGLKGLIIAILVSLREKVTQTDIETVLKSNLGFLVDSVDNKMAFAVLSSIDVFNVWTIVLLGMGFAFAAKWTRPKATVLVAVLYCVIVLFKIGTAALQSIGSGA